MWEDSIIVSEPYGAYGDDPLLQTYQAWAIAKLQEGYMSKEAIWQRMGEWLKGASPSKFKSMEDIFRTLCNSPSRSQRCITEFSFISSLQSQLVLPEKCLSLLFRCLLAHAAFPFPIESLGSTLDIPAFSRGILLFRYPDVLNNLTLVSGKWGPCIGSNYTGRDRDVEDTRRLLFRTFAAPLDVMGDYSDDDLASTKIRVPAFIYWERDLSGDSTTSQAYKVLDTEDERHVDVLDVLTKFRPRSEGRTAPPLRQCYKVILPSLPSHCSELYEMQLSYSELCNLIKLQIHSSTGPLSLDSGTEDDLVRIILTAFEARTGMEISWNTLRSVLTYAAPNLLSLDPAPFPFRNLAKLITIPVKGFEPVATEISTILNARLPPLATYPLHLQLAVFLPLRVQTSGLSLLYGTDPSLSEIARAFEVCPTPVLFLLAASPSLPSQTKQTASPIILGVFTTSSIGLDEESDEGSCSDSIAQVFQLQPIHRVFSALPSEVTLSFDRERPQMSRVAFDATMKGGVGGKPGKTTLLLGGNKKDGVFMRAGERLDFKIDGWWLYGIESKKEDD